MLKNTSKSSSKLHFVLWNLVLAAVIAVVLLMVLLFFLRRYTQHGVETEVPEITGLFTEVAEPMLRAENLSLEVIDSTYSSRVPLGTIVEQNPPAHSHVKPGRAIYVIVNARSRKSFPLPDLRDVSVRQAMSTLQSLGLLISDTIYEPSEYRDLVLDVRLNGNSVEPGTKLEEGQRIQLVVGYGKGTEEVAVPSLRGLTLQEARSHLLSAMLTLGAVEYDEQPTDANREQYRVFYQTPSSDAFLLQGSRVDIRLSLDPDRAAYHVQSENADGDEEFF